MGGLAYGSTKFKKAYSVRTAAQAAQILTTAGSEAPSEALVAAYQTLLTSFTTSHNRPVLADALAAAEAALADAAVWQGAQGAHSAALAQRGQLRLEATPDDWQLAEQDGARNIYKLERALRPNLPTHLLAPTCGART